MLFGLSYTRSSSSRVSCFVSSTRKYIKVNAITFNPEKKPKVPGVLKDVLIVGKRMVKSPANNRLMDIATEAPYMIRVRAWFKVISRLTYSFSMRQWEAA